MEIKQMLKRLLTVSLSLATIVSSLPVSPPAHAAIQPRAESIVYPADSYGAAGQTDKQDKNCGALFDYSGASISALEIDIEQIIVNPKPDKDHPDAGGTYTAYCMDKSKYGAGDNSTPEYSVNLYGPSDQKITSSGDASIARVKSHKDQLVAAVKLGYDCTDPDWNHKAAFRSFYGQSGKPNLPSVCAYGVTKMAIWSIMEGWDVSKVTLKPGVDSRVLDAYKYIMTESAKDKTATASSLEISVEGIDGKAWKTEGEYITLAFAVRFQDETALNRIGTGGDDTGKVYLSDTSKATSIIPSAFFSQYDNIGSVLKDGDKIARKDEQYKFKLCVPKNTEVGEIDKDTIIAEVQAEWDSRKMASMMFGLPSKGNFQPYLVFGGTGRSHALVNGFSPEGPPVPPDIPNPPGPTDANGSVSIKKVDKAEKTKGLAGATFHIESKAANYSANGVTGSDGTYRWNNLPFLTKDVPFICSFSGYSQRLRRDTESYRERILWTKRLA